MIRNLLISLFGISACFVAVIVANEAIVGGHNAEEHEFPYQVSVFHEGWKNECGGGIIDDKHILTAAHCVLKRNNQFYPERLFIRAGTNNLLKTSKSTVTIEVEKIFISTDFNSFFDSNNGDVAVLRLKESLELSQHKGHLRKLKLPENQQESYAGKTVKFAGFGWNSVRIDNNGRRDGNNTDNHLHFTEADVLNHSECQQLFPKQVSDQHMCARVKQPDGNLHGVCKGDSGGPLVLNDSIVIGVLSRSPRKCGENIGSGVYTRVSHYLTFISDAMKDTFNRHTRTHEPAHHQ